MIAASPEALVAILIIAATWYLGHAAVFGVVWVGHHLGHIFRWLVIKG